MPDQNRKTSDLARELECHAALGSSSIALWLVCTIRGPGWCSGFLRLL